MIALISRLAASAAVIAALVLPVLPGATTASAVSISRGPAPPEPGPPPEPFDLADCLEGAADPAVLVNYVSHEAAASSCYMIQVDTNERMAEWEEQRAAWDAWLEESISNPAAGQDPRLNTAEGCLAVALLHLPVDRALPACADRVGKMENLLEEMEGESSSENAGSNCPGNLAPAVASDRAPSPVIVGALLLDDCPPAEAAQPQSGQLTPEQIAEMQRQMRADFEANDRGSQAQADQAALLAQQQAEAAQRAQAGADTARACAALVDAIQKEWAKPSLMDINEAELNRLTDEFQRLGCQA